MTDLDQIARIIRSHPALGAFPEASQARITATLIRVGKRGVVSIPRESFALVGFGLVKTAVLIGRSEFITHLAGPGESIGLYASLKSVMENEPPEARLNRPTQHNVITESATVVFVPARSVLTELTNATPGAARAIALSCGAQEQHTLDRLTTVVHGSSDARVATMLLDLVDRYGDVREDGTSFVPFHFTRAELAALCGVTVETLIRKFSAWAKTGLVTDTKDSIEIRNAEELRLLTGVSR